MLYYIYLVDLSYFMIVQSHFYFSLVNLHTAIAIKISDLPGILVILTVVYTYTHISGMSNIRHRG